jgi:hypothetical protein
MCGAVAHLGERFNGIEEVAGSIPASSTNFFISIYLYWHNGVHYLNDSSFSLRPFNNPANRDLASSVIATEVLVTSASWSAR